MVKYRGKFQLKGIVLVPGTVVLILKLDLTRWSTTRCSDWLLLKAPVF